jgi:hypothetical protein
MVAAVGDGNKDNVELDRGNDNNRQTSSAQSNFIVRILFLALTNCF